MEEDGDYGVHAARVSSSYKRGRRSRLGGERGRKELMRMWLCHFQLSRWPSSSRVAAELTQILSNIVQGDNEIRRISGLYCAVSPAQALFCFPGCHSAAPALFDALRPTVPSNASSSTSYRMSMYKMSAKRPLMQ
jgi:hypothetical protein